jgi:hypothetical protein
VFSAGQRFQGPRICRGNMPTLGLTPNAARPKRRPEDQAGLRTRDNLSTLPLRKSEVAYIVAVVRKRRRAWRGALGDKARAGGEKLLFGIAVTH